MTAAGLRPCAGAGCANTFPAIGSGRSVKKYCSDRCRNTATNARRPGRAAYAREYRGRHPERYEKHWKNLPPEGLARRREIVKRSYRRHHEERRADAAARYAADPERGRLASRLAGRKKRAADRVAKLLALAAGVAPPRKA